MNLPAHITAHITRNVVTKMAAMSNGEVKEAEENALRIQVIPEVAAFSLGAAFALQFEVPEEMDISPNLIEKPLEDYVRENRR